MEVDIESNGFPGKGISVLFFSNEERRMHIHVECEDGEAKFWIEPIVSLAVHYKLNDKRLNQIQKIVEKRKNEIVKEWERHFGKR